MLKVLSVLRVLVLGVPVLVVLLVPQAQAQDERVIAGRVVDASGKPVGGVIVTVTGANLIRVTSGRGYAPPRVLTAADGRFVFRNLPDGSFGVTATKNGYAEGAYGRRRPAGSTKTVALNAAQPSAEIAIQIWKNGAIAGTLTDEAGEPVAAAQLRACKGSFVAGVRRFMPVGQTLTDDRGAYRFSNLQPGDYIVVVSAPRGSVTVSALESVRQTGRMSAGAGVVAAIPGMPTAISVGDVSYGVGRGSIVPPPVTDGRLMVYPPTYYPSALSPSEAAVVTLASGQERSGVDIQVQPVATAHVAGVLLGPTGPASGTSVRLAEIASSDAALPRDEDVTAPTDLDGRFVFPAVPMGRYVLRAFDTSGSETLWLEMPVTVGGDIDGFVATLRNGLHVSARMVYDGAPDRPRGTASQTGLFKASPFELEPVDGSTALGFATRVSISDADGITLAGFSGGRYFIRVPQSPQGWMFKSAVVNGVDVSDTPFDLTRDVPDLVITFTDRWSGLGGTVHDANGNPDTGAAVLVFPANADGWRDYGATPRRLKSGATNARGEFGISSLPPGEYYAIAVPEDQADNWRDPRTLEALARIATPVTISEGEHRMIALRTKEVGR